MAVSTADEDAATSEISVEELLTTDMTHKVIVSITLPTLDETKYVFKSYKVMLSLVTYIRFYFSCGLWVQMNRNVFLMCRKCTYVNTTHRRNDVSWDLGGIKSIIIFNFKDYGYS